MLEKLKGQKLGNIQINNSTFTNAYLACRALTLQLHHFTKNGTISLFIHSASIY